MAIDRQESPYRRGNRYERLPIILQIELPSGLGLQLTIVCDVAHQLRLPFFAKARYSISYEEIVGHIRCLPNE